MIAMGNREECVLVSNPRKLESCDGTVKSRWEGVGLNEPWRAWAERMEEVDR